MTIEQAALKRAIRDAFAEAVEKIGYDAVKRMSMFGSSEAAVMKKAA